MKIQTISADSPCMNKIIKRTVENAEWSDRKQHAGDVSDSIQILLSVNDEGGFI